MVTLSVVTVPSPTVTVGRVLMSSAAAASGAGPLRKTVNESTITVTTATAASTAPAFFRMIRRRRAAARAAAAFLPSIRRSRLVGLPAATWAASRRSLTRLLTPVTLHPGIPMETNPCPGASPSGTAAHTADSEVPSAHRFPAYPQSPPRGPAPSLVHF